MITEIETIIRWYPMFATNDPKMKALRLRVVRPQANSHLGTRGLTLFGQFLPICYPVGINRGKGHFVVPALRIKTSCGVVTLG